MWRRRLATRRIRDKQTWRKDLRNYCHLAKLEVLLKLSCWNAALGPGQSHVNLIFLCWMFADVFLQTLFPSNILHASILHIAMFAYKRQKQTLQADFFFQFFSELSLNVLLHSSWGDAAVVFLCRLRSSPCVRYGGKQPLRQRWRKTLRCHRDADDSAPSVKGKTDCGG